MNDAEFLDLSSIMRQSATDAIVRLLIDAALGATSSVHCGGGPVAGAGKYRVVVAYGPRCDEIADAAAEAARRISESPGDGQIGVFQTFRKPT